MNLKLCFRNIHLWFVPGSVQYGCVKWNGLFPICLSFGCLQGDLVIFLTADGRIRQQTVFCESPEISFFAHSLAFGLKEGYCRAVRLTL